MSEFLKVENVSKSYKDFLLDNVSFTLNEGEVLGCIGNNGAGKTTLIKILLGIKTLSNGHICYFGNHTIASEDIKNNIGFIPDMMLIPEHYTALFAGKVYKSFYKKWNDQLFQENIKKFNLPFKKKVGEFSKGMKIKLMLALVLSYTPKLLIMDEVTEGLDPLSRNDFLNEIVRLKENGTSIIFSTHNLSDIGKTADKLLVLKDGKTLYMGDYHNLEASSRDNIENTIISMLGEE